jgi:hypothetical protein
VAKQPEALEVRPATEVTGAGVGNRWSPTVESTAVPEVEEPLAGAERPVPAEGEPAGEAEAQGPEAGAAQVVRPVSAAAAAPRGPGDEAAQAEPPGWAVEGAWPEAEAEVAPVACRPAGPAVSPPAPP